MNTISFTRHAINRMADFGLARAEVEAVIRTGEVIERYQDARPYPSRLVLGSSGSRPLHVVAATSPDGDETFVVTVYEPSSDRWEADLRTRKVRP